MKKLPLFLLMLVVFFGCKPVQENTQPNIIFIMSDDHASKAISAYDTSLISTPNIDRIAEEGIRFDRCFCTNAICAPSRAVILTGKYSHMNGVLDNSRPFDGSQPMLPKYLKESGYQTAIIGKWHLKSNPKGFDYWFILPGQGKYYRPDFITPEGPVTLDGYVTDIITDKGIEWLENRDPGKPFFMMLHHKAPHRNWQPAIRHLGLYDSTEFPIPGNLHDAYEGKSRAPKDQAMSIARHMSMDYDLKVCEDMINPKIPDRELWFRTSWGSVNDRMSEDDLKEWENYYAQRAIEYNALPVEERIIDEWKYQQYMEDYLSCIAAVDESTGRILDYLKESGLDKNTIVIYTSDQGFFLGEHGWYDKRFMYEEAHKMPLLIRVPGIKPGIDKHMITNADFAPTILGLAGIKTPADMQGESFHTILQGDTPDKWRKSVYYHYFEYPAVHSVKRHYGIRTENYKLIHFYFDIDEWELYDLKNDPQEMKNLINDTAYKDIAAELKTELQKLRVYYQDTEPEKYLPALPDTISHLAKGISYTLKYQPSERYPGNPACLTDGMVYPEGESYSMTYDGWCGFKGDDLILELAAGQVLNISKISAGFLQNQESWIFLPGEVNFFTSEDGLDFMGITTSLCEGPAKDPRVMKQYASAIYPGINTRFIRIHAKNILLPEWHRAAGKPAWLFIDEVIVTDKD